MIRERQECCDHRPLANIQLEFLGNHFSYQPDHLLFRACHFLLWPVHLLFFARHLLLPPDQLKMASTRWDEREPRTAWDQRAALIATVARHIGLVSALRLHPRSG